MTWQRALSVPGLLLIGWAATASATGWLPRSPDRTTPPPPLSMLPSVTAADRLLIVAPHEDDETLGAGGLIQQAVAAGAAVRVVYLTYGDHNELGFLLYKKRPSLTPAEHARMGELRRREAIHAMARLGVPADHLVFLGYPDGDTLDMWKRAWGETPPWRSRATRTSFVPYADAASYGHPHKGEAILQDLERELLTFRPTHVAVTQPVDGHPDHRACYLYLEVALLNVAGRLPTPQLLTYPIHIGTWPHPYGFRPQIWLPVPTPLTDGGFRWWMVPLTKAQVTRKQEAIRDYRSQLVGAQGWMTAFARRNELFAEIPPLTVPHEHWGPPAALLARPESPDYASGASATSHLTGVAYGQSADGFQVRLALERPLEEELGVSLYLFGYRHDCPFASMPKLHIESSLGRWRVSNQHVRVDAAIIHVDLRPREAVITVPWSLLEFPEIVLVQAQGVVGGMPMTQTSWRTLLIAPELTTGAS